MKIYIVLLLIFTMGMQITTRDEVKVISFNIRYGTADDGKNSWPLRKNILFDFIKKEDADFLGLQEAMIFQVEEILENCHGYDYVGRTREIDGKSGEATPILYKPENWDLVEHNTRWLSETPENPGTKSWDSSLPRIFTYAKFRRKSDDRKLVVYNTHFDHISSWARYESSKTIISHMNEQYSQEDIVLLGDFNALETADPITYLLHNDIFKLHDGYRKIQNIENEDDMTCYGWNEHIPGTGKRIDYIFYKGNFDPQKAYVSNYNVEGRYPSDHMPVVASFSF